MTRAIEIMQQQVFFH